MYECPECRREYPSAVQALDCQRADIKRLMQEAPRSMKGEPCIVCGKVGSSHLAHWPVAKGIGGRSKVEEARLPRVPACFHCHIEGEHIRASRAVEEKLIANAPAYWERIGKWDLYRDTFERWVSLNVYKGAVKYGR